MPPAGKKRTAASIAKFKATMRAKKAGLMPSKVYRAAKSAPSSLDALIYLRHAIKAADADDTEGLELYARLAKRVLEGKE